MAALLTLYPKKSAVKCLHMISSIAPPGAEIGIYQKNKVNNIADDALAPFVARTPVAMVLTQQVNVLHGKDFNNQCHLSVEW